MKQRIDDAELQAYVDGRLPAAQRPALEAKLQGDAEAMARVAAYRQQNELLRAALDPWLTQPIPDRLQHLRVPPRGRLPLRYGAMAASLLLAGAVGWFLRGELQPVPAVGSTQVLVQRAAQAHLVYAPEVLHPVEVGAAEEQHLVQWLSKRLGKPVRAPQLDPLGFHLVGGRLLPGERRPAAQFMYQDANGRRLTLYVAVSGESNRETAFRYAENGGISTFYWVEEGVGYALAGELEHERLLPVAQAVYRQVNG